MSEAVTYIAAALAVIFTLGAGYFYSRNKRAAAHSTEDINTGIATIFLVAGAALSLATAGVALLVSRL